MKDVRAAVGLLPEHFFSAKARPVLESKASLFSNKKPAFSVNRMQKQAAGKEYLNVATVSTIHETELVTRAQNGERNAFGELVRMHTSGVLNVVYRMCGDQQVAEDAAQETFIQAWLHLSTYRHGTSLRNWLYRIAVNAATDMLRKEKRILPALVEELHLADPRPGPEALYSREEQAAWVQRAVSSLPEASRAVLVLREYEGFSYQEIAEALDIPVGTVMSRLNYARGLLKDRLERRLHFQAEVENV